MSRTGLRRLCVGSASALSLVLAACGQAQPFSTASPQASAIGSITPTLVASAVAATPTAAAPSAAAALVPDVVQFRVERSRLQLPAARSRAVALAFDSSILVSGGLTSTGATTDSIERIDPRSGQVSRAGTLAAPVHDAGGATLDGTGFILGGGRFGPGSTVQQVRPGGSSVSIGRLPAVRADLAAVSGDGELIVVGGGTPTHYDERVLATTDGRHFRTVARLLVGVRYPAVAVLGGIVYVVGGSTAAGDSRDIQAVDPRTGVVRIAGHLPGGLSHAAALVVGGNVLIAGGRTAGRAQGGLWRYDPITATVVRVGRLPYPVSDMAAIAVDGIGYLIGGEDHGALASIITIGVR